jgi:hypothetical protein
MVKILSDLNKFRYPMSNSFLPVNKDVDCAVRKYCETIIEYMKAIDPDVDFELDYDEASDEDETHKASIADIQTEYGFVTIFPDFNKNTARAAILNRGMIQAMELEGFDDDTINNSPVYGTLMPFTVENAELFAIMLTNDLDLQHQKLIY